MKFILIRAISWFADLLLTILLVQAVLSWFVRDINSPVGRLYGVLSQITEPIVGPIRDKMSQINTGMFDFSVLIAMILIEIIERLLIMIISFIF